MRWSAVTGCLCGSVSLWGACLSWLELARALLSELNSGPSVVPLDLRPRTVPFSDFPLELVHKVIHHTTDTDPPSHINLPNRLSNLSSLCLVNHAFNAAATELLYEHLLLPTEAAGRAWLETARSDRWTIGAMRG